MAEEIKLNQKKYFLGRIFVSFLTEKQKYQMLEIAETSLFDRIFKRNNQNQRGIYFDGNLLKATEAPEPKDINWNNFDLPKREKIITRVKGWLVWSGSVLAVFIGTFLINLLQNYLVQILKSDKVGANTGIHQLCVDLISLVIPTLMIFF